MKISAAGGERMDECSSSRGPCPASRSAEGRGLWGLVDEVVGCQWGVWDSREAKEGFNDTPLGPFAKASNQGSGFGLVMSVPLHICQLWTEGAAEKTAVTERPAGKRSTTQGWRLHTDAGHFKQANRIWKIFQQIEDYNPGQSPVHHGTRAQRQFTPQSVDCRKNREFLIRWLVQYVTQGLWVCTNPCILMTQIPGRTRLKKRHVKQSVISAVCKLCD